MGRHRRSMGVRGGRSTAVKAAAAVGVATALAFAINETANGPIGVGATSAPGSEASHNRTEASAPESEHAEPAADAQPARPTPTALATQSAARPKALEQTQTRRTSDSGKAPRPASTTPTQTASPSTAAPASQPPSSSEPASSSPASPPESEQSTPPSKSPDKSGGRHDDGPLGDVVGGVGSLVGGLLG